MPNGEPVAAFLTGMVVGIIFVALFPLDVALVIWAVTAFFTWLVYALPGGKGR